MFFCALFISGVLLALVESSERSANILASGISKQEREFILKKHNDLRSLIMEGKVPGQPKGKNLKTLKYSSILAKKAQEIADSLEFKHKEVSGTEWTWVGQNLYMSSSTAFAERSNWDAAIQAWFDEHKVYHYGQPFSSTTGHYTQVVWADTDHVGCGYTHFKEGSWYQKLYVCNYGPGGNIQGQHPYKVQ